MFVCLPVASAVKQAPSNLWEHCYLDNLSIRLSVIFRIIHYTP